MNNGFLFSRMIYSAVVCLAVVLSACQVKQKPYLLVEEEPKPSEGVAVKPIVYVSIHLIPKSVSSLLKLKEIMKNHPELKLCLAIPYNFIKPSEKHTELMGYFKEMESDGRLSFFHTLHHEPVLSLLSDNSDYIERSYLSPGRKPHIFEWPEDIRDQVVLEREAFLDNWGVEPVGFMPFGGLLDKKSVRPVIQSKTKMIISGALINEHVNVGRIKELAVFCCHESINEVLYSGDFIENSESPVDGIMRCLDPISDLYTIVFDEKHLKKRRGIDTYKLLGDFAVRIKESEIEFILPGKYLEENRDIIPSIRAKEITVGSWLSADLSPWIGELEEDVAWEMLARCRNAVEVYKDSGRADIRRLDSAMEEIYAAESSRNFYYFGNDFDSPGEQELDQFFRAGLSNVYRLIKISPPEELYQPISLFKVSDECGKDGEVSVKKGDDFIFWRDFAGDDSGASSLIYPVLEAMSETAGLADILSFGFKLEEDFINMEFTIKRLDNFWNAPMGFSFPLIDLYIDLNNRYGAGSVKALRGRKVSFSEQDAWEYVLVVNGWGARLYRSASDNKLFKVTSLECKKGRDNQTIIVKVPRKVLRGDPFNWGYAVLVMGYARLRMKEPPEPMGVALKPSENNFTSSGSMDVTPVVDIIVPEGRLQKDILKINSYSGSASVPVLRTE